MTKKSYSRRSYRRRRTNKKNKITKLKSKKKSYKKGGMFRLGELASAAGVASPAPHLVGEEGDLLGDCTDISAMKSVFEIIATKDVRNANITVRHPPPANAAFDASLKPGDIVELNSGKGESVRWFGVVVRRAPANSGVYVRWFKEVNAYGEGETFSLELDELQPRCNFNPFDNIIGIVEF